MDRFRVLAQQADKAGHILALVLLDIDHFQQINNHSSFAVGDDVLAQVAQRLTSLLTQEEVLARIGDDEFAMALLCQADGSDALERIGQLRGALASPIIVDGKPFALEACTGGGLYPIDDESPDQILRKATIALKEAKALGPNQAMMFDPNMDMTSRRRRFIDTAFASAMKKGQLQLYFQPQVALTETKVGRLAGAEALMRWFHPQRGLIRPDVFIPAAEENGLIVPAGIWALQEVCERLIAWRDHPVAPKRIAVNISARQLACHDFIDQVATIITQTGVNPSMLELELTESAVMHNVTGAIPKFQALREIGVQLAIDDFGSGYTCLDYLKKLPVDCLKINRSFIQGLPDDWASAAITKTLLILARELDLRSIAEGVETQEQLAFVREHGCHEVQGFFFSRALPEDAFLTYVETLAEASPES